MDEIIEKDLTICTFNQIPEWRSE